MLSSAERSKRYRDYQLVSANSSGGKVKTVANQKKQPNGKRGLNYSYATMSQCSKEYALALMDPWAVTVPPCVPDNITLPSYKFNTQLKGVMSVGTAGVGYVALDPYAPFGAGLNVVYTIATYPNAYFFPTGVTGNVTASNDSSFIVGDFQPVGGAGAVKSARLVSTGMKMRYIGSEINRGGRIISARNNGNALFPSGAGITAQVFLLNREAVSVPVSRDWHYVIWRPALPTDLAYLPPAFLTLPSQCMVLYVEGAVPGVSFEFEILSWWELIGLGLPGLTKSHSDPLGFSAITSALPDHQPLHSPEMDTKTFMADIAKVANETFSFISNNKAVIGDVVGALGAFI